jgi:hypothetical protein
LRLPGSQSKEWKSFDPQVLLAMVHPEARSNQVNS